MSIDRRTRSGSRRRSRAGVRPASALLCCALLGCAHLDARAEQEERTLREIRVAADAEVVAGPARPAGPAPALYCLGHVRILGEDPPIWEVADEDPAGLAMLSALRAPVAPASACGDARAADGGPGPRTVRVTVEQVDRPDPSTAVVRVGVWPRDPPAAARGEGWTFRMRRAAAAWEVMERERTWSR